MTPHYEAGPVRIFHGDCIDVMRELPDNSVDAVVTDPPYGLEFMGKAWDSFGRDTGNGYREKPRITTRTADDPNVVSGYAGSKAGGVNSFQAGRPFQEWCELWAAECFRVLKPGGHILAFGGSRTWHRLAAAVEDSGFEIRDSIAWLYGSGFPKSMDVSKAIDKQRDDLAHIHAVAQFVAEGRDRSGLTNRDIDNAFGFNGMAGHWTNFRGKQAAVPKVEQWQQVKSLLSLSDEMDAEVWRLNGRKGTPGEAWEQRPDADYDSRVGMAQSWTEGKGWNGNASKGGSGVTDAAKVWEGWGTALKPAFEPIVVGRKPLQGTVAGNVLAYGVGALNIDATRVPGETIQHNAPRGAGKWEGGVFVDAGAVGSHVSSAGRWPANVVLDETQAAELDKQSGPTGSWSGSARAAGEVGASELFGRRTEGSHYGDFGGGASRFFPTFRYEAKAPGSERPEADGVAHPTVKPLDLMRWLVRLVTPPGGTVLEPFAGSGTTAEACVLEGFGCIAIEREADYLPLIRKRIQKDHAVSLFGEDWN